MNTQPWQGIVVAVPTLFKEDLSLDLDAFQEHVGWLAENGCHGVTPAGSLGEYQVLTERERKDLILAAVEAAPKGFSVVPGVSAYGADEALRWSEEAAKAGAAAVLCQPPNSYRANDQEVIEHFKRVAGAGLPIMAYNNPVDNRVDLTPELLYEVAEVVPLVVAIKDFSGNVTRPYQIKELTPQIDIIAGMDGVVVELLLAGATGWLAGFPNSLPQVCAKLYHSVLDGDLKTAMEIYDTAQLLFLWDANHQFVQAIKLSMDVVGRYGGPVRLPRTALDAPAEEEITRLTLRLAELA